VVPTESSPRDLVVGLPASLIAGVVVGTIGTFKHQVGISAATGSGLPVGLVLSLLMVAAFLVALRVAFASRWYAVAASVGVVAAGVLLLLPGSSGGSTVVLLNAAGITWTFAPSLVAAMVIAWPRPGRRRRVVTDPGGILEGDRAEPSAERRTSE
jgi:N-acetyl-1-D-myo-inositol-2-amino-2-deoxy-alpha-D-glucopyranoside deacetylase